MNYPFRKKNALQSDILSCIPSGPSVAAYFRASPHLIDIYFK